MHSLLVEVNKYEPSIIIVNPTSNEQLILAHDPLPRNEKDFKKYFTILTDTRATSNQQHIIIGCKVLSKRTFKEIKFDKNKPQFLAWLTQEKIFIESDLLGVTKTMTIGYLTKLHPQLTNRTTLKTMLQSALEDITLDEALALELDPTLKDAHKKAHDAGDMFVPILHHSRFTK